MNLATVIGTIWSTQKHPSLEACTLHWIQPQDVDGTPIDDPIVAVDTVGACVGERVFFVSAKEAVIPLPVDEAPVDAAVVGIVEGVEVSS